MHVEPLRGCDTQGDAGVVHAASTTSQNLGGQAQATSKNLDGKTFGIAELRMVRRGASGVRATCHGWHTNYAVCSSLLELRRALGSRGRPPRPMFFWLGKREMSALVVVETKLAWRLSLSVTWPSGCGGKSWLGD